MFEIHETSLLYVTISILSFVSNLIVLLAKVLRFPQNCLNCFHLLNFFSSLTYDNFVSNLKLTLSMERQNSFLRKELRKKGSVDRLCSELENTKEQLQFRREDKGN